MLTFIVSVLASLSILFGSPAPAPAPVEVAQQQVQQQQQQVQQPIDEAMAADAYAAYDALEMEPVDPSTHLMLSYVSTVEGSFPDVPSILGYFAVASRDLPNTYHIMQWSELHNA